ncbi:MAG: SpoIVB peptidase S55 domain-containing protein [Blastocatellia bacterium]
MARLITFLTLLLTFPLAGATGLLAQTTPGGAKARDTTPPGEFFPFDQVRAGMRGVGWTVLSGREPVRFECEILGVMKGFQGPRRNAIIIRLLGDPYQHTGIFQGMSGSPVYIEGKLAGAVSFGFQFAKDPIGGITPIEEMIEIFEQAATPPAPGAPRVRSVAYAELIPDEKSAAFQEFVRVLRHEAAMPAPVAGAPMLTPIATPLAAAGIAPDVINLFAGRFRGMGMSMVAGAAGAAAIETMKPANGETLKPGSTIEVPLVRGDFSLSAAGTVTYRNGNKIYAFGHPFLSMGQTEMPMNEGEVVTVLPNAAISFKISSPTALVGTISGDRATGIYGELGRAPRMIPVEINVQTSLGASRPVRFDMVSDRFLTPLLMQICMLSTVTATERSLGDATLSLGTRIKLKGQPDIQLENRMSASANTPLMAAFAVAQPLSALFSTGFTDLRIEGISLDIRSLDTRNVARLERLWVNHAEARRGETIEVHAFARREDGTEHIERIPLTIPEDIPAGEVRVTISDGQALQAAEPRSGFTPRSLEQMVGELNRIRKPGRLYARLSRADSGALIGNEELPSLPPSVLATLGADRTTGGYTVTRTATLLEKELPAGTLVITGQRSISIHVRETK